MDVLEFILLFVMTQSIFWPSTLYKEINRGSCYAQEAWAHEPYPAAREKCTVMPLVAESKAPEDAIHINAPAPHE